MCPQIDLHSQKWKKNFSRGRELQMSNSAYYNEDDEVENNQNEMKFFPYS